MSGLQRNYTVDLMRVVAAFGVIAIHVHADTSPAQMLGNLFSPLCVPFFYIASLMYFVAGLKSSCVQSILHKSFTRILVPYFVWTIIYTALLVIKAYLTHDHRSFVPWRILLYGESAVQLYYLPDLFALQLITLGLYVIINPESLKKIYGMLLLTAGIVFFWAGNYNACFGVAEEGILLKFGFLILCGFLLPSFFSKTFLRSIFLLVGVALTIYAVASSLWHIHFSIYSYPVNIPLGGLGLMLIALGAPIRNLPKWVSQLSTNSYGIYLSHILFLEGFEFVVGKALPGGMHYNLPTKLFLVLGIFILSAVFTSLIRKINLVKQVLLGEGTKSRNTNIKYKKGIKPVLNSF